MQMPPCSPVAKCGEPGHVFQGPFWARRRLLDCRSSRGGLFLRMVSRSRQRAPWWGSSKTSAEGSFWISEIIDLESASPENRSRRPCTRISKASEAWFRFWVRRSFGGHSVLNVAEPHDHPSPRVVTVTGMFISFAVASSVWHGDVTSSWASWSIRGGIRSIPTGMARKIGTTPAM